MHISKMTAIAIAASAMLAAPAFASDMISGTGQDWSGFYAGVHGGAGVLNARTSTDIDGMLVDPIIVDDFGAGIVAGVDIGYDYDMGSFVIGVGASADWAMLEASGDTTYVYSGVPVVFDEVVDVGPYATLTGRVGAKIGDDVLVYGKGGVAVGQVNVGGDASLFTFPVASYEASSTQFGWTVGAGVEVMLTADMSLTLEYDHLDFGSVSSPISALGSPTDFSMSTPVTADVVKAGVSFRF